MNVVQQIKKQLKCGTFRTLPNERLVNIRVVGLCANDVQRTKKRTRKMKNHSQKMRNAPSVQPLSIRHAGQGGGA